jgi:hypothetical protein
MKILKVRKKIETLFCAAVGTSSLQDELEACTCTADVAACSKIMELLKNLSPHN